jgi:hypothetical protein
MLKVDDLRTLHGHQVNGDDASDFTYYILPEFPTYARMASGGLALRFVEYGQLREDGGKKFGGFIAFDVEFSVPEATQSKIVADLQKEVDAKYRARNQQPPKVVIAPINYVDGTASLLLKEGTALVERISGAGMPSLFGRNVTCFMVELSELGTAIFKETLSTGSASSVQVVYNITWWGRLPPMHARGEWHAREFYSFFQDINTEDNFWSEDSYTEVVNETRYKNDVTKTTFDFVQNPNLKPEDQAKLEADVRASINKQLEAAVQRNLLKEIQAVDPNTKDLREGQDIEDIRRTVMKTQMADVVVEWFESKATQIKKNPQGMLPTITSLKGADNKPLKWEDYYSKINVDEFLKTVQVVMRVNADFTNLPIHSVEVKIRYPHGPNAKVQEFTFTKPDDVFKFEAFTHQAIRKVLYSYLVNYKNSQFTYQSEEVETDDTNLTIGVDDLGILTLDIAPGDINFGQVQRAQIVVRYSEAGATPIEKKFNMTKDANTFAIREIIKRARSAPITYQVTYQMEDGREIKTPERSQMAKELYIDDPFTAMKTVGFRAVGDLDARIQSISLSAVYNDKVNDYKQMTAVTLSKSNPFFDWTFPVIDEDSGEVTYSGSINLLDSTMKDVPETVAKRAVVQVGEVIRDRIHVDIVPDLIDWSTVKLVNVSLQYSDQDNDINKRADFRFKSGDGAQSWDVPLTDASKNSYSWSALFFMTDGSRKTIGPSATTDPTIFVEVPQ